MSGIAQRDGLCRLPRLSGAVVGDPLVAALRIRDGWPHNG
jgi:hypothetical protein